MRRNGLLFRARRAALFQLSTLFFRFGQKLRPKLGVAPLDHRQSGADQRLLLRCQFNILAAKSPFDGGNFSAPGRIKAGVDLTTPFLDVAQEIFRVPEHLSIGSKRRRVGQEVLRVFQSALLVSGVAGSIVISSQILICHGRRGRPDLVRSCVPVSVRHGIWSGLREGLCHQQCAVVTPQSDTIGARPLDVDDSDRDIFEPWQAARALPPVDKRFALAHVNEFNRKRDEPSQRLDGFGQWNQPVFAVM